MAQGLSPGQADRLCALLQCRQLLVLCQSGEAYALCTDNAWVLLAKSDKAMGHDMLMLQQEPLALVISPKSKLYAIQHSSCNYWKVPVCNKLHDAVG